MHETVTPALFAITASRGRWRAADHLLMLSDKLTQVAAGELKRLMVFMPPRHGKSEMISKYFPAWYLGHHPDHRVILSSYEADFAASWGWKARNILEEYGGEIFGVTVNPESSARNRWDLTGHDGGMNTAGAGGPITGKGAHCLIGSTPILTSDGTRTIESIVQLRNRPLILAYNHKTGCKEWCRILATYEKRSKSVLEIETICGRKIRTTRDHHVFVDQQGYKEACSLHAGDRVLISEISEKPDMPTLWDCKEGARCSVSGMLSEASGSSHNNAMLSMWDQLRNIRLQCHKSIETWSNRLLLFKRMFSKAPCNKECEEVCSMRKADAGESWKQVLLGRVSKSCAGGKKTGGCVYGMRNDISSIISSDSILFPKLCEQCTFKMYDRGWKFTLQKWDELFKTFFRNETPDFGKGSLQVCDMRGGSCLKNPSYQRRCDKQRSNESDNNVSVPPHNPSQIEYDTISGVREIGGRAVRVYDLQVEGCNNFFAGEILVHNCFIIDDPIKNSEEAHSEIKREKLWEWYQSTAYTRLEPEGAIILIQTRWHQDDLGGRLLAEMERGGEQWDVLNFPAIAEENDLLGRKVGEPLWKERYSLDALNGIEEAVGQYYWYAMYQQSPYTKTGGLFERTWFEIVDTVPRHGTQVRFWDLAATEAKKGTDPDWTVGVLMAHSGNSYYVKDVVRVRKKPGDVEAIIRQTAQLDGIETRAYMEQEPGSSGKGVIATYAKLLAGYAFYGVPSTGSKTVRAQPLSAAASRGDIKVLNAAWLNAFLSELELFPNGAHDDIVDATSAAYAQLTGGGDPSRFRFAGAERKW